MPSLRSILSDIKKGNKVFRAKDLTLEGLEKFKPIAKILIDAERRGFITFRCSPHPNSMYRKGLFDLIAVDVLTEDGEQFLNQS